VTKTSGWIPADRRKLRRAADTVELVDWDEVDPAQLYETIRQRGPVAEAERTIWAFEKALEIARVDPELLEHLLIACVCLVARQREQSPRTVLEQVFRRSVGDGEWHERYAPLLS
jgi:hypothetical protein